MADYLTTDTELTSIANAIRTRGGTSAPLVYPQGFISAIQAIPMGGMVVTETTDTHGGTIVNISGDTLSIRYLFTGSDNPASLQGSDGDLYFKGSTSISAVYKKVNGTWTSQSNLSTLFDSNTYYTKG